MKEMTNHTRKNHEVFNPDKDTLNVGSTYELFGVMNCNFEAFRVVEHDEIGFRIAMRLPSRGKPFQALIEVFCDEPSSEPRFEYDWSVLQNCYLKNAIFTGISEKHGLSVYNFKIVSMDKEKRFIWLSRPEGWIQALTDLNEIPKSPGSVFGSQVSDKDKILHTQDKFAKKSLNSMNELMDELEESFENRLQRVIIVDGKLTHRIINRPQHMHL